MKELKVLNATDMHSRDLSRRGIPFVLIWGVPVALFLIGEGLQESSTDMVFGGALLTLSTLWFGTGCFYNGRLSRRVHCMIDGVAMPLLGALGVLILIGIISVSWSYFIAAFWVILLLSFVPEMLGKRYIAN